MTKLLLRTATPRRQRIVRQRFPRRQTTTKVVVEKNNKTLKNEFRVYIPGSSAYEEGKFPALDRQLKELQEHSRKLGSEGSTGKNLPGAGD